MIPKLIRHIRMQRRYQQKLAVASRYLARVQSGDHPGEIEKWVHEHLGHPFWPIRNIAVKIAGLSHVHDAIPILCKILGDVSGTGFVKRNAADALIRMKASGDDTLKVIADSLTDDYYEVRARCADALFHLAEPDERLADQVISLIFKRTPQEHTHMPVFFPRRIFREKNFEVRGALTRALGALLTTEKQLRVLELLLQEDHWRVRAAAIEVYAAAAVRRGHETAQILKTLETIDLTSQNFVPMFPIRQTLNESLKSLGVTGNRS